MIRNRLIDGWRGFSILLVITGHLTAYRFAGYFRAIPFHSLLATRPINIPSLVASGVFRILAPLPWLGVCVFFVISGYLITKLLLKEERERGAANITAFYVRRIFRILPAFYVLLAAIFLFAKLGLLTISNAELFAAGTFFSNTEWGSQIWWLGHTWSLSVEEQFYLLWPLGFWLLGRRARAGGLVVVFVLLLLLSCFDVLTVGWLDNAIAFSCIAAGALYAVSSGLVCLVERWVTGRFIAFATFVLLFQPFVASVPIASKTIELFLPALVTFIVFGTLNGKGMFVRLMSTEILRLVGVVSYSLYLWQQVFLASSGFHRADSVLDYPFLFVPCALASYFLIEKPMIKIGHRISSRMLARSRMTEAMVDLPATGEMVVHDS